MVYDRFLGRRFSPPSANVLLRFSNPRISYEVARLSKCCREESGVTHDFIGVRCKGNLVYGGEVYFELVAIWFMHQKGVGRVSIRRGMSFDYWFACVYFCTVQILVSRCSYG